MQYIKAKDLLVGDFVDLQNDPYADPNNDKLFDQEYVEVENVEIETDRVVRVDFVGHDSVGFPAMYFIRALNR